MAPGNAGVFTPFGVKLLCRVRLATPVSASPPVYTWISPPCAITGAARSTSPQSAMDTPARKNERCDMKRMIQRAGDPPATADRSPLVRVQRPVVCALLACEVDPDRAAIRDRLSFVLPGFLVVDRRDDVGAGGKRDTRLQRDGGRHLPGNPHAQLLWGSVGRAHRNRRVPQDGRRA